MTGLQRLELHVVHGSHALGLGVILVHVPMFRLLAAFCCDHAPYCSCSRLVLHFGDCSVPQAAAAAAGVRQLLHCKPTKPAATGSSRAGPAAAAAAAAITGWCADHLCPPVGPVQTSGAAAGSSSSAGASAAIP